MIKRSSLKKACNPLSYHEKKINCLFNLFDELEKKANQKQNKTI